MRIKFIALMTGCLLFFWGSPEAAASRFDFSGQIDFDKDQMELSLVLPSSQNISSELDPAAAANTLSARINKLSDERYTMSLKLDHMQALVYDLSTEMETSLGLKRVKDRVFPEMTGQVTTQFTLVDLKPIRDVSADFEVKDNKLQFKQMTFGNVTMEGGMDLQSPYKMDFAFKLNAIAMPDFLNFWTNNSPFLSSGQVSGVIKVSGTPENVFLKGSLEGRGGSVQGLDFDSILLNAEGTFPHLNIAKSTIASADGAVFSFEGPIDLGQREDFEKQVRDLSILPVVNESGNEMSWTLKRVQEGQGEAAKEIQYMIRKDDFGSHQSGSSTDLMGLKRTVEF